MSYLLILLSFLFVTQTTDPEPKTLSITATADVELPADQIRFNININAEADTPQAAYNLHQKREKALVQLLDKYEIKEDDISYEPVSISKKQQYNRDKEQEPTYQTQQTVNIVLRDFSVYEKIQVGLIENSFDNFSGNFMNSTVEAGKEQALRKAVQEAKAKAQIIADEAGVNLGSVMNISYNINQVQPYARESVELKAQSDSGSLLKYNQTVTVSATISMDYEISG
jgi:uncharacterized protein YggE